jgi:hypothetical protein
MADSAAAPVDAARRASSDVVAQAPAPPPVADRLMRTEERAGGTAAVVGQMGGRAAGASVNALRESVTRLVVDPAYVDSVLAADSLAITGLSSGSGAGARKTLGYAQAGTASAAPSPAPAAPLPARAKTTRTDGIVSRAAGCWTIDTSAWSPRAGDGDEPLLPSRVELRTERGLLGDEWGELILRPAPGERNFPAGSAATWKPIGRDGFRMTMGDSTQWTVVTVTLEGDSLRGRARSYEGKRGRIRTAGVTGQRVVCRTER